MADITGFITAKQSISGSIKQTDRLNGELEKADTVYKDDYAELKNKPSINGVELIGDKSFDALGDIALTNTEIFDMINTVKGLI